MTVLMIIVLCWLSEWRPCFLLGRRWRETDGGDRRQPQEGRSLLRWPPQEWGLQRQQGGRGRSECFLHDFYPRRLSALNINVTLRPKHICLPHPSDLATMRCIANVHVWKNSSGFQHSLTYHQNLWGHVLNKYKCILTYIYIIYSTINMQ